MHAASEFKYEPDYKAHYKKHSTFSLNFPSGGTKIEKIMQHNFIWNCMTYASGIMHALIRAYASENFPIFGSHTRIFPANNRLNETSSSNSRCSGGSVGFRDFR